VKWFGKYRRKESRIVIRYGLYRTVNRIVKRYGKYGGKASRIVKRHDKDWRKVANSEMIWKIWKKSKLKC
jgi:hypothetical protein